MIRHMLVQLSLVVLTALIGSVLYPLAVLGIGQGVFPHTANGSLITKSDGTVVGSELIAQQFKGDEWFQPRPSAVDYNAAGSGGSNLGANNPKLRERVTEQLKSLPTDSGPIPADAVTTSGSGLDPFITVEYAKLQIPRIAKARNSTTGELESLIAKHAEQPIGGAVIVNVMKLNRDISMWKSN